MRSPCLTYYGEILHKMDNILAFLVWLMRRSGVHAGGDGFYFGPLKIPVIDTVVDKVYLSKYRYTIHLEQYLTK